MERRQAFHVHYPASESKAIRGLTRMLWNSAVASAEQENMLKALEHRISKIPYAAASGYRSSVLVVLVLKFSSSIGSRPAPDQVSYAIATGHWYHSGVFNVILRAEFFSGI